MLHLVAERISVPAVDTAAVGEVVEGFLGECAGAGALSLTVCWLSYISIHLLKVDLRVKICE